MTQANLYGRISERLRSSKRILAATHINPDGDALGSLCFFKLFCQSLGKECVAYCAGPLPASFQFLPGFSAIITDKETLDLSEFDTIVSLDCGSVARTNLASEIAARSGEQHFIEIDHHPSPEKLSDIELRETNAASTTEILFRLAEAVGVRISGEMSNCLLTGVLTDTAHFIHPNVTTETIATAADLVSKGANITRISDSVSRTQNIASLKLWGTALSRLTKVSRYDLAYTVITAEDFKASGADEDSLSGVAGFLAGLEDAKFILLLLDTGDGMIRGSLRTARPEGNVTRLARFFGGGGHVKASGFTIPGRLERVAGGWRVV